LLNLRLHPREYTRWLEAALTAARKMGNREAEGAHLGNLGLAYAALGETRRAIELYEQRLVIAREIGDRRGEGADLGNLGSAHFTLKDYPRAVEYYNEQRVIAQEIGDRRGVGNAFWGQAICFEAGHDLPQAIAHAEAALAIFVAIESPSAQTMRDMLARWRGKDATDKSG
jgi:tetratricopeptide (TPR) repeat protein